MRKAFVLGAVVCLCSARMGLAQETAPLLTNAVDIISLSADEAARALKARVVGTVTAADLGLKGGRFFVQDATAGIFVDNAEGVRPEPGTVVEVTGITHPGAYAPIITAPTVRQVGTAPLPEAKPVPIERLMSGAEDSQRIQISGVVRDARIDGTRLVTDIVSGGYRFRAYGPVPEHNDPQSLVAAQVLVRGTAAEAHNRSLRQLIAVELYVPTLSDFEVEKPESVNPLAEPVVPLDSLAQYRRDNSLNRRVHVRGVVTLQRLGDALFLRDATGGLQVQSRQLTAFTPGQVVEAVGFPSFDQYLPVLQDATFRATADPPVSITPKLVSIEDLQNGLHHADFVSVQGRLINRTVSQASTEGRAAAVAAIRTTLVLQNSNVVFAAEAEGLRDQASLSAIPLGSTLEVSGICLTEIDSDGKVKSFRVLLGSPAAVRVLARPSWLTTGRLLIILGVVCSLSLLGVGWTVLLSRKNAVLNSLMREREKAQRDLQEAHDHLEQRVKERTEELKFQITARKETELQSKAVLAERTRLAQELHDTVEQTLTGIALQLDTAAKLYQSRPANAREHLDLARNLMGKSQVELRRSVWDLRQRELDRFDLPGALLESARQIAQASSLKVDFETHGTAQALPEIAEENLLRIAQEALTNVIKHARATQVNITLDFGPHHVSMEVEDNGTGFDLEHCAGPADGHFGLLGMAERAKRIGGRFLPVSRPGTGTLVRVEVPLGPMPQFQRAARSGPEPIQAERETSAI
ncbi:MAG TPA: histidine kinase [Candidatus Acidoferrum sp.]|nr:histidine kinase [Candidatus Acidoferrum sp.]